MEQKEKEHAAFVEQMARSLGIPNLATLAAQERERLALFEEEDDPLFAIDEAASMRSSVCSSSPDVKRPSSMTLQNIKRTEMLSLFDPETRVQIVEDHEVLEKNETDSVTLEREELKRLLYLASPFAKMVVDEEPLFMQKIKNEISHLRALLSDAHRDKLKLLNIIRDVGRSERQLRARVQEL